MPDKTFPVQKVQDYAKVVRSFYDMEQESFFECYHKCGGSKEDAIASTLHAISPHAEFYTIDCDCRLAAFFVKTNEGEVDVLEGFHVNPAFRRPEFFQKFWNTVKQVFGGSMATGIYTGNEPAIRHLLLNGFVRIKDWESEGKQFALLIFNPS